MTTSRNPSLQMVLILALGVFAVMFHHPSSLQATVALRVVAPSPCVPSPVSVMLGNGLLTPEDEDNHVTCSGDEVTATISEEDGAITIHTCVTNGSCSGTWGGADIEVTGTGRLCVKLTFLPESE